MGHERGDQLLQDVAERLRSSISEGHVAARLGGDEFAVIASAPVGLEGELKTLAAKIGAALEIDIETAENTIRVGASLGIALFPGDSSSAGDILRHADTAMYAAKAKKGGRIVFYSKLDKSPQPEQENRWAG
jgi:diguanylate cyclase (GGDEF)-like protein